jgi:uncharacterized membrane protein YbhN (UPF0104 family)
MIDQSLGLSWSRFTMWGLKCFISIVAVYAVVIKIDWQAFYAVWQNLNGFILLGAFFLYNLSQLISALRMREYLALIDIRLDVRSSIHLCYLGMLYNLFLPGGIGGDGYKVYYLKRRHAQKSWSIIRALLGDRLNGFLGLLVIAWCCVVFNGLWAVQWYESLFLLLMLSLCMVVFAILQSKALGYELGSFVYCVWLSTLVQGLQALAAVILMISLGEFDYLFVVVLVFFLSSLASQLPITLGGVGTREVTMVYGFGYLGMDPSSGLAMALLFFIVQSLSNLLGLFCYHYPQHSKLMNGV